MALSMWTNMITGQRLDDDELHRFREHAHRLYEANTHIFEDERDAAQCSRRGGTLRTPEARARHGPPARRRLTTRQARPVYAGICSSAGVIVSKTSLAPGR